MAITDEGPSRNYFFFLCQQIKGYARLMKHHGVSPMMFHPMVFPNLAGQAIAPSWRRHGDVWWVKGQLLGGYRWCGPQVARFFQEISRESPAFSRKILENPAANHGNMGKLGRVIPDMVENKPWIVDWNHQAVVLSGLARLLRCSPKLALLMLSYW